MFVSYAQNAEDVILNRIFAGKARGTYVDVGASHPTLDSVTQAFYDRGWNGINVEPLPDRIAELAYARPRDLNLRLALADRPGTAVFHVFPTLHGLSTLSAEVAERSAALGDEPFRVEVEVSTLAIVLEAAKVETLDFLKIDVEGAEAAVLAGMDFSRWRPTVVVVEATAPGTPQPSHETWEPLLIAARYRPVLFDGLNRFYLAEEAAALAERFTTPPNVFDGHVVAKSFGDPLENRGHPDHDFAVHLASTWLNALALASDTELTKLVCHGLPAHILDGPVSAAGVVEAYRRVFGKRVGEGIVERIVAFDPRPSLREVIAGFVGSDLFRAARARVAVPKLR